jgi:acyl dehydratase
MPLNYEALMAWPFEDVVEEHTNKDTMLYALGLGLGSSPTDPAELRFVFEDGLRTCPTMSVVLGRPGFFLQDPRSGVDWRQILHGEQRLRLHAPIPPAGRLTSTNRVERVVDKGPGRAALVYVERHTYEEQSGQLLASQMSTLICRADGGFGDSDAQALPVHPLPDRAPELTISRTTLPQAALIYRLSGDWNPIHADPQLARAVGFERPILQGLCTYGIAGYAVTTLLCNGDPDRVRRLDCRFSKPVFPGETITTELWREAPGVAAFRCTVAERDVVVIDNGLAELDP